MQQKPPPGSTGGGFFAMRTLCERDTSGLPFEKTPDTGR